MDLLPYQQDELMREDLEVNWLIDKNSNSWDLPKIKDLFTPLITNEILKIHLSTSPRSDKWIWIGKKNRNFSVRSAYCLLKITKKNSQGEGLDSSRWKKSGRIYGKQNYHQK